MRNTSSRTRFLSGALLTATTVFTGHAQGGPDRAPASVDLSVTYATERARLAPGNCGCFWVQGGGVDAALSLWRGLSFAGTVSGQSIGNYAPGYDFNKISYLAGPRYTWKLGRGYGGRHPIRLFGEGLFGGAHGFRGTFPSSTGIKTMANSYALQAGGGMDLPLSRHAGLRLLQAEYVRTGLPNGYADTQNNLRLSAGFTLHLGAARGN